MDRLIKRYQNRKLYDTVEKKYIKLADIQQMIRDNIDVRIVDNVTGNDMTRQILVQLVMRAEQNSTEKRVPLEGLKDLIQSDDRPVFQAFRGVLNFSRDVVHQIGNSVSVGNTGSDDPSEGSTSAGSGPGQLSMISEMLRKTSDRLTDSAVKVVNGTLAREMLKMPTRKDLNRLEQKFELLEQKLSELNSEQGESK